MKKDEVRIKKRWFSVKRCVVCDKLATRVTAFYFPFGGWTPMTVCSGVCAVKVERDPDRYDIPDYK